MMTEVQNSSPQEQVPATEAARFLAKRGLVVMKQFHEIGTFKCEYGTKLTFSTLVFAIAQGGKGERTFGLRIEHENADGREESCLVDFDELKELLLAIKHLLGLAKQTATERSDYTEFEYRTKDYLKVGFFQDTNGSQQAFFDVAPGGSMMFLGFDGLRTVFELIKSGREYLIEKGAGVDAVVSQ
jgi:hypothetical protein